MISIQNKICKSCGVEKPIQLFQKRSETLYRRTCKDCQSTKDKAYSDRNKDKISIRNHKWYEKTKESRRLEKNAKGIEYLQTLNGKFSNHKATSKIRGINFELSFDDFCLLWQKPCYYCHKEIKTIGIDRVNNAIGYVASNVVPACKECNVMKLDKSLIDFINSVTKIYNRLITQSPS